MDDRIPSLIFGGFLLLFGGAMLMLQLAADRKREHESLEDSEQAYFFRRRRRRIQVAGMIILIGLMIPFGDSIALWENAPATFAIYWMTVLGLTLWTVLLAVGDMLSTKIFSHGSLKKLEQQRSELERAAEELRRARQERDSLN